MLNSRTRKMIGVAAAFIVVASLAACTPGSSNDDGKLTIFAAQDANNKLAENSFTKLISKKVGEKFVFQTTTYDGASAKEKRQISLASGDYPDAYMLVPYVDQFSQSELLKYGQQGVLLPLNDLIDKYAPNIKAAFKETPAYREFATAPDGKIWGLPQWNDCLHCSYHAKLWMNTDWLKKLGLSQPKTTDDLFNVLMAFKTKDPNGNGKADEIPLSSSVNDLLLPYFMNAFLYDPQGSDVSPSTVALDNGKVTLQANQDEWRDGLAFVKKLYDNGLIDDGAFTQNRDALKAKGDSADGVIVGSATMLHPAILVSLGQDDGRDRQYDAVPPLTGPTGVSFASYNAPLVAGGTFVLTNKASKKDQIAAIKTIDYLFAGEGRLRANSGIEGVDWAKPDAGDVALNPDRKPEYKNLPIDPNKPLPNNNWGSMAQYNMSAAYREANAQPTDIYDQTGYERRLYEATLPYQEKAPKDKVFPYWNLWPTADSAAELAELRTNIENAVSQQSLEFVTGTKNIADDAQWAAYKKSLDDLGLKRYLKLLQEQYDAKK